ALVADALRVEQRLVQVEQGIPQAVEMGRVDRRHGVVMRKTHKTVDWGGRFKSKRPGRPGRFLFLPRKSLLHPVLDLRERRAGALLVEIAAGSAADAERADRVAAGLEGGGALRIRHV